MYYISTKAKLYTYKTLGEALMMVEVLRRKQIFHILTFKELSNEEETKDRS